MDASYLLTSLENSVFTIQLNRPKANAFNTAMSTSLLKALRNVDRDPAVRAVVLTGAGRLFSAGQDVTEFQEAEITSYSAHLQKTYNPLVKQIRTLTKPVIAAVNGTVAGAALGIVLACDLRIAAENAKFVVGFLGIGLVPDSGVSLFLPALIGLGRAAEFAFSNKPITAEQALAWGLVNRLAPADALQRSAAVWAQELAQGPVGAYALTKRAFNKAVLPNLDAVLDNEAELQDIAGAGDEHIEGVLAFLQKRSPRFLSEG